MQDIKVRKRTKNSVVRKDYRKIWITFLSTIAVILLIIKITTLLTGWEKRYDNGLYWVVVNGSQTPKMPLQSVVNHKEVLSAIQPKKQAKKVVSQPKDVWTAREAKYKPLIEKYFPEEPEVMLAIAKAESSLNSNAINYNCFYDKQGNVHKTRPKGGVSTHCKKGHEKFAWSKDGCIFQVNDIHGKDISTVEGCLQGARKVYEKQGKRAWVAYNTGAYKKYLAKK